MHYSWSIQGPCRGTLYLCLVASKLRTEILHENTAFNWPKPTDENGLPQWPCYSAMKVVYSRFKVCDITVENEISLKTIQAREMTKLTHNGKWDRYNISKAANLLPVAFIQRGCTYPILFSKTIHILSAHSNEAKVCNDPCSNKCMFPSVAILTAQANLEDIKKRWLLKLESMVNSKCVQST
jgi:hypothetical protein